MAINETVDETVALTTSLLFPDSTSIIKTPFTLAVHVPLFYYEYTQLFNNEPIFKVKSAVFLTLILVTTVY